MKNSNNKAFTLAEAIVMVAIVGFLTIIVMSSFPNIGKSADILRLKNANLSFRAVLTNVLQDATYYSNLGLSDTSSVEIDGIIYTGDSKFRELIFRELEADASSPISCYVMTGNNGKYESGELCRRTENGITWGIPASNFDKDSGANMVEAANASGTISKYLPITIYPITKNAYTLNDYHEKAVFLGVRADGALVVLYSVNCSDKDKKSYYQCNFVDYVSKSKATNQ